MAGDWTAIEHATPKKSEIGCIVIETGRSRHEVLGLMVEFWIWAETETDDGRINLPFSALPTLIGGDDAFWRAVVRAGWISFDEGIGPENATCFSIPRADHWLSKGAKARLANSRRQATRRASVAQMSRSRRDKSATREEKRREEKSSSASAEENPLPPLPEAPPGDVPEFDDHAERDEPDWLIVEAEFIAHWNALEGVATNHRNSLEGTDLCLPFRRAWRDHGWRDRAHAAMRKFPLRNGVVMSLRKFLSPTTIDEILGGVHDFEPGKRSGQSRGGADATRVRHKRTKSDFSNIPVRRIG